MSAQREHELILLQGGLQKQAYANVELTEDVKMNCGTTSEDGIVVAAAIPPHSQYAILSYPGPHGDDTISFKDEGGGGSGSTAGFGVYTHSTGLGASMSSVTDQSERKERRLMAQQTVTKGEFDANIRRFDETVSNLKENIDTRLSSMEEKIDLRLKHIDEKMDLKFDTLTESVRSLAESVNSQRKEIHDDNQSTRVAAYAMIITAIIVFLGIVIALMRL